jgi:hypothetical protein
VSRLVKLLATASAVTTVKRIPAVGNAILGDPSGSEESNKNKQSITLLQYPEDIGSPGQGHFIILKIHDIKPGKVVTGSPVTGGGSKNRSLALKGTSKRVKTQISLYMPPQVEVSYKSNYEDVEIGSITSGVKNAIDAFRNAKDLSSGIVDVGSEIGGAAAQILTKAGVATADLAAPGAAAALFISAGKIQSSKMELLFKGVGRRAFNYTFVFIPKSSNESKKVDQIIFELKKAMLPTYTSGFLPGQNEPTDKNLTIPTTFDIEYMYTDGGSARNNFLNKISTCYLTDLSVKYGGDRYKAYKPNVTTRGGKGAPPQRTEVSLTFNEIEIITQEDINLGF